MKRRWRRVVLMAAAMLLSVLLVVLGAAVWLYQSGRLANLSQDLLQRLSGQEITIDSIEFPSWNTVVFTNVHLQQPLPGWRLAIACPRLEAHYGLAGLLNKQIDHLLLLQPQLKLSRSDTSPPPQPVSPPGAQPAVALPLKRLLMQQGTFNLRWRNRVYTVQHIEAVLRPQRDGQLHLEAHGSLEGSAATFQVMARTVLGTPQPIGDVQLIADAVPLAWLAEVFSQGRSSTWKVTQGALHLDTNLHFQAGTMHGRVTATIEQVTAQAQDMTIRLAVLSTAASLEADYARQTIRLQSQARLQADQAGKASDLTISGVSVTTEASTEIDYAQQTLRSEGQARLQADRVSKASDLTVTEVSLSTPWRLSHAPDGWQISATPVFQSQTAEIGTLVRASRLSLRAKTPVQVQHQAGGWQVQGAPEFSIQTVRLFPTGQTQTPVRITSLQGRLPLRGSATSLDLTKARLQTQAWHWQTAPETQLLAALTLQGSSSIDLRQQRLIWRDVVATLPQLGNLSGSGEWHWPSHTLHDVQVQLAPTAVDTLWKSLQDLLPAAYHTWHAAGHTDLQLRARRLSLRPPRRLESLLLTWQIRDGVFSSPDSTYAGEHLNATLQATAGFDDTAGQYTLQGTLTLQPFALLISSVFPAIEENHMTSVLTFSGVYRTEAESLQLYLAGQFRDLGTLTLQGMVQRPFQTPQYDLQMHVRDLRAGRFQHIFVHDALRFPTLAQAMVQGTLNVVLHMHGQPGHLELQGTLDLTDGHLDTGTLALRGVSLVLPLQMQYPLPQTAPEPATLPPAAYGRLSLDALRLGGVEVGRLRAGLALRSDNVFFQPDIHLSLLGGQIVLEHLTVQHMLQAHRRVQLQARLQNLDLQRWRRGASTLPLAGMVNGEFSRLQLHGDQLDTQGSLTIALAGGTIRLFDLQGSDVWSGLPTLRCSLTTEQPLSLRRLTDIYPIGGIGGTVHFRLTDLTLTGGEPAAFSLEFEVQEKGGESREITLRALNNLLFTTGSAKVAAGFIGESYSLPYKRFGANVMLHHDTLRLRGKYHDSKGLEYFMQAPALGSGVSIVNRVPENGIPFRDFLQRLKATVLEKPNIQVQ
jgi:hypothetical protein